LNGHITCCLQILPSLASLSIYMNIYEHLIKNRVGNLPIDTWHIY
jgi:hypothetical protein